MNEIGIYRVLNYCSLLVCRVIEDLIPRRFEEGYDPTAGLLAYSKKVILRMKGQRQTVGGRRPPEEYWRLRELEERKREETIGSAKGVVKVDSRKKRKAEERVIKRRQRVI
ncbi:unnamed protein product [Orchesella dallaii]|uniref:Uncharacterized protein n=1 Tax=Orchesella dallaii TaxID=48710 RepID=A0ABP1R446_9HEXA